MPVLILSLVILVILCVAISLSLARKTPLSQEMLNNQESIAAMPSAMNPYFTQYVAGPNNTWSLALNQDILQLNWFSDSTSRTVWDSWYGICGPNSTSYNTLLTNNVWFQNLSSSNFVPQYPNSNSRLMSTEGFTLPNGDVVRFNLTLYMGFLRIETDMSAQFGAWNNFQGIAIPNGTTPLPINPAIWPMGEGRILWQLRDESRNTMVAQFRENGNLSVVLPTDPFLKLGHGASNWYANQYVPYASCSLAPVD